MLRSASSPAAPFLKWAGGKQSLLTQYRPFLPAVASVGRYYEPFIGSAALFFHWRPARATLADVNASLIEVYQVVQLEVEALIAALRRHVNDEAYFYEIRSLDPGQLSPVERAARLIYLNKTCYNGLYRENRRGQFNVPFGRYANPTICDAPRLRRASRALRGVRLCVADFAAVVEAVGPKDFVYFDPPYAPLTATSSFTSYSRFGFDAADQHRLAQAFHRLSDRGCRAMLSNSSAPLIYDLYQGHGYRIETIQARRPINSRADRRGPVTELLILNFIDP